MIIFLNGESKEIREDLSVAGLLAELGLADKRVAVEVNGTIVPRSRHGEHLLADHDKLEIVVAVGGG
jgi:sulfur carrier protein